MLTPDELTGPERRLWKAIETGALLSLLEDGTDEEREPENGAVWGPERTVRAEVLIEMLTSMRSSDDHPARAVRLCLARITGMLDLEARHLLCPLDLRGCFFDAPVLLDEVRAPKLAFVGCHFPRFIGRQLETRGDVSLADSHARSVSLHGAHIGGQLDLCGAQLINPKGIALNANGAKIDGGMFCQRGFRVEGELQLLGARIGGQLTLSSAQLSNPAGNAVMVADRIQIGRGMFCREGFRAEGELRLLGAHIGGQLSLTSAQLSNPKGKALSADGAHIDEDMVCREGFRAEGELRLVGAHIGGQLDLTSAQLSNPKGKALDAAGAHIDEDMFCREGFRAEGELRLLGAHIGGQLDLTSAQLSNPGMSALGLQRVVIMHVLLPDLSRPEGTLDLTNARVTHLEDDWPKTLYTARISGLTYETISPLAKGAAERLDWLSNADGGFQPQPYEQLATVLRRIGRDDDARRVAIAKEKGRRAELNFTRRVWNWFLALAVGYGYQPWRGVLWLGLLALIGWPVFAWARAHHHFVALNEKTQHLPQFHSWLYSLDSVLPVINLGQKDYWSATGAAQYWQTASVLAGWILVTVILAAVTTRLIRD